MRSPKYRSILGRHVRLPFVLVVMVTAAAVGLSGAIGLLIGSASGGATIPDVMSTTAHVDGLARPAPAGIAVTGLTVDGGIAEPRYLGVGDEVSMRVEATLADGTSRQDAPVRWFSSDNAVVIVDAEGLVTGLAPGQARVHAVLPPFDASTMVVVGRPGATPHTEIPVQPDPDRLVRLEQRLLDWVAWTRARQGTSAVVVDEARRGALRTLVAHALRQGGIDQVRLNARQLRAVEDGGWAVRLWSVGTPANWDVAGLGELQNLIGDEAASVLTDPGLARVSVGLVFDARTSDQLWAGVAVHHPAP